MPTYEYACRNCPENWDEEQRISDPKTVVCPCCGERTAVRLIPARAAGFILKGDKWERKGGY